MKNSLWNRNQRGEDYLNQFKDCVFNNWTFVCYFELKICLLPIMDFNWGISSNEQISSHSLDYSHGEFLSVQKKAKAFRQTIRNKLSYKKKSDKSKFIDTRIAITSNLKIRRKKFI